MRARVVAAKGRWREEVPALPGEKDQMTIIETKFPSGAKEFTLDLPVGAQILTVRSQGPQPILVAAADLPVAPKDSKQPPPAPKTEKRTFSLHSNSLIARGGAPVEGVKAGARYVGMFELGNAPWFVFELPEQAK